MRVILAGIVSILLAVLVVLPRMTTAASAAETELKTAIFHAGELAQRGEVLATSQLHVQHVVNCLEGPTGKNFKVAAGHVCQGQGNGIIPDLQKAVASGVKGAAAAMRYANAAYMLALDALKMNDVNAVQPWAKVIASNLQQALNALQ